MAIDRARYGNIIIENMSTHPLGNFFVRFFDLEWIIIDGKYEKFWVYFTYAKFKDDVYTVTKEFMSHLVINISKLQIISNKIEI